MTMHSWRPDVLRGSFTACTLDLGADEEGPVVATIVRSLPPIRMFRPMRDVDVLYVHGWSDYFFQTEVARFWNRLGARFYALDLRKYGRSIRPWQTRGDIVSLDEYDADLSAAFVAMGRAPDGRGARRLVLVGHSTGGLTLSLWAARHPGIAAALVLNSPWLEFQAGALGRAALTPILEARARLSPRGAQPEVDLGFYTRAQRTLGTLPQDEAREQWRPERGFPTHPAWLHAILRGHATVAAGIEVGCPALVLLSARSTSPVTWRDEMTRTDSVLVVDDVARVAPRLGRLVTVARIDGALHDVFLSAPGPRAEAFRLVSWWMRASLRPEVAGP